MRAPIPDTARSRTVPLSRRTRQCSGREHALEQLGVLNEVTVVEELVDHPRSAGGPENTRTRQPSTRTRILQHYPNAVAGLACGGPDRCER